MSAPYTISLPVITSQPPTAAEKTQSLFVQATALLEAVRVETLKCNTALRAFPVDTLGLVSESVRASDEYQAARQDFATAYAREQRVSEWYSQRILAVSVDVEQPEEQHSVNSSM